MSEAASGSNTTKQRAVEQLGADELLQEEVQRRPHLYNLALKEYKDIVKRQAGWSEVADILGRSQEDVQARFSYLRREYGRIRKESKTKSGQAAKKKLEKEGAIWRSLSLLDSYITSRNVKSNLVFAEEGKEKEDVEQDEEEDSDEENRASVFKNVSSTTSISMLSDHDPSHQSTPEADAVQRQKKPEAKGTKRKAGAVDDLLAAANATIQAATQEKDTDDESSYFAKSVAESLRSMCAQ